MKLGQVVATSRIVRKTTEDGKFFDFIVSCLERYRRSDWGDTCEEDQKLNNDAVKYGNDRIVAKYDHSYGSIFIITEYDRSATTILFAEEY